MPGSRSTPRRVLIVELDGHARRGAPRTSAAIERICREAGARELPCRGGRSRAGHDLAGPKGRVRRDGPDLAPDYYVQDGVVPAHASCPTCSRRIDELASEAAGFASANVFHAGDGNLHPLVLYDAADPGEAGAAPKHSRRRSSACCLEPAARSPASTVSASTRPARCRSCSPRTTSSVMDRVRRAFDPTGLCNPGKVFPTPRLCGEAPGPYRAHPIERAGLAERW